MSGFVGSMFHKHQLCSFCSRSFQFHNVQLRAQSLLLGHYAPHQQSAAEAGMTPMPRGPNQAAKAAAAAAFMQDQYQFQAMMQQQQRLEQSLQAQPQQQQQQQPMQKQQQQQPQRVQVAIFKSPKLALTLLQGPSRLISFSLKSIQSGERERALLMS